MPITTRNNKYRAEVTHKRQRPHSMYVTTRAEAVQLEAQLMMGLGVSPVKGKHSVEEVIDGYIADGRTHLSAGTIDFYVKGRSALL